MRTIALLTTLSVLCLSAPVLAKQPPEVARKVACNKGWAPYMKANKLQGVEGARAEYQAKCIAGAIEPPVKVKGPKAK
jgi:hypothetical protein